MTLERVLQIHVALLCTLGTVLLGMGQDQSVLPLLVGFAAVTSLCFTDILGWFRLNRVVVNMAATIAMGFCLIDFLRYEDSQKLLAVAHLLVYWQVVMLYQAKSARVYWCLLMLSLLQVVVAAVLNVNFQFGAVLILYLVVGFFTLTLFFVLREMESFDLLGDRGATAAAQADLADQPLWQRMLGHRTIAYQETSSQTLSRHLLTSQLARPTTAMGLMTILVTLVFFYFMPRTGESSWTQADRGRSIVGFSRKVTLGEMSNLLESEELVMRTAFYRPDTNSTYTLYGEPYFRGTVLHVYVPEGPRSNWVQVAPDRLFQAQRLREAPKSPELVLQDVVLEPTNRVLLFSIFPFYSVPGTPRELRFNPASHELYRIRDEAPSKSPQYSYTLGTTAFRNGTQNPIILIKARHGDERSQLDSELGASAFLNRQRFPTLVELAERILQEGDIDRENRILVARRLQDHLLGEPSFVYSTNMQDVPRTPGLDPIEDFVANHRTGYCEHYASALAMMLRSQGIPSRIVVGFKGGDYNTMGRYYQVRSLHAHAWVEAYLEPHHIPADQLEQADGEVLGAWLRLDPTPGRSAPVSVDEGVFSRLGDSLDYAQLLWNDYVTGLDSKTQEETIYAPLRERTQTAARNLFDLDWWRIVLKEFFRNIGFDISWLQPSRWFSWQGGLIGATLALAVTGLTRLARYLAPRCWTCWRRWRAASPASQTVRVEFYERLEAILARHGWQRSPGQTQREFARFASAQVGRQATSLAAIPATVAEAFYEVRFGGNQLPDNRLQSIHASLEQLESALDGSSNGWSTATTPAS